MKEKGRSFCRILNIQHNDYYVELFLRLLYPIFQLRFCFRQQLKFVTELRGLKRCMQHFHTQPTLPFVVTRVSFVSSEFPIKPHVAPSAVTAVTEVRSKTETR